MRRSGSDMNRAGRSKACPGMIPALLLAGLCLLAADRVLAGQTRAVLFVPDRTVDPGKETFAEAILLRKGLLGLFSAGIQGEILLFLDDSGAPLAQKLTDPSGMARAAIRGPSSGLARFRVELAENSRFRAEPETGRVFVWHNARPPLLVCVEGGLSRHPAGLPSFLASWGQGDERQGSREALSRLGAACDLAYLTRAPRPAYAGVRKWLQDRRFPEAPILLFESPQGLRQDPPRPSADVRILESLWKDRRKPAYLVTAEPALAKAAAECGFWAYLLESEPGDTRQTGAEPEESQRENPVRIQGWEGLNPGRMPGTPAPAAPASRPGTKDPDGKRGKEER